MRKAGVRLFKCDLVKLVVLDWLVLKWAVVTRHLIQLVLIIIIGKIKFFPNKYKS